MLESKIAVIHYMGDNDITGIPRSSELRISRVKDMVYPRNATVPIELFEIQPGTEEAGNSVVVVSDIFRDRIVIIVVQEIIDAANITPSPLALCVRNQGPKFIIIKLGLGHIVTRQPVLMMDIRSVGEEAVERIAVQLQAGLGTKNKCRVS